LGTYDGQPNTIEDCAEHRTCDQPNPYSTTSGQDYKGGTTVSPVPEKVSQRSFPDPVTNTVPSRTCLQAHLERMIRASGYDRLPSFGPSCIIERHQYFARVENRINVPDKSTNPFRHGQRAFVERFMYGPTSGEVQDERL
jgi:hypothetical protein